MAEQQKEPQKEPQRELTEQEKKIQMLREHIIEVLMEDLSMKADYLSGKYNVKIQTSLSVGIQMKSNLVIPKNRLDFGNPGNINLN